MVIVMSKKDVVLIAFYNTKALGVRYLANALKASGYVPHIIFLKGFNSATPGEGYSGGNASARRTHRSYFAAFCRYERDELALSGNDL